MIYDSHVHIFKESQNSAQMVERMKKAGISGGLIISLPPQCFPDLSIPIENEVRVRNLMKFCGDNKRMYPFYWIDPLEDTVKKQIEIACDAGVKGFKIICDRFYPDDYRAMATFRQIADRKKPILFHSGILWDGKPSSKFNRPAVFESLLEIKCLKFALAHIGWPWCEELAAVYGKFADTLKKKPDLGVEMFVDLTPGTPINCRKRALDILFSSGYCFEDNLIWGTDCTTDNYDLNWAAGWFAKDTKILSTYNLNDNEKEKIFAYNMLRFIGSL